MSGSPIILDGKLVGAVTHVLVNDPIAGYGIFIENMLGITNRRRNSSPAAKKQGRSIPALLFRYIPKPDEPTAIPFYKQYGFLFFDSLILALEQIWRSRYSVGVIPVLCLNTRIKCTSFW